MPVGCAVTLRRARMWEFVDRLVTIATPRIRDFRGYNPRAFDGRGNYTLGVREQIIFPEIDYDTVSDTRGLDIAITTTAATDEEAFELLLGLGFPFAQEGRPGAGGPTAEEEEAAAEEARKEEARQRAEAEQAALEQLKEENPEAYEKPEPADEDAEGETRRREKSRKTRDGKDFTTRQAAGRLQVQEPQLQPMPQVRPVPCRVPQVRPLPDLPARGRAQGLHPRHDQVELVGTTDAHRPDFRLPDPGPQRARRRPSRGRDPRRPA